MSAVYEDVIALPLLSRTAGLSTDTYRMHGATGLYIMCRVKTAGTSTLTVRLFGIEPFESTEYQVNLDETLPTTIQTNHILVYPGVALQPDGEAAATTVTAVRQVVGVPVPDKFRFTIVKGDASAWEFGLAFRRVP